MKLQCSHYYPNKTPALGELAPPTVWNQSVAPDCSLHPGHPETKENKKEGETELEVSDLNMQSMQDESTVQ